MQNNNKFSHSMFKRLTNTNKYLLEKTHNTHKTTEYTIKVNKVNKTVRQGRFFVLLEAFPNEQV